MRNKKLTSKTTLHYSFMSMQLSICLTQARRDHTIKSVSTCMLCARVNSKCTQCNQLTIKMLVN